MGVLQNTGRQSDKRCQICSPKEYRRQLSWYKIVARKIYLYVPPTVCSPMVFSTRKYREQHTWAYVPFYNSSLLILPKIPMFPWIWVVTHLPLRVRAKVEHCHWTVGRAVASRRGHDVTWPHTRGDRRGRLGRRRTEQRSKLVPIGFRQVFLDLLVSRSLQVVCGWVLQKGLNLKAVVQR